MATGTAFGPQGQNAATSLPAGTQSNRYGTGVDTWVSGCGQGGGTVLDPAFFNMILGNLRNLVKGAIADGATIDLSDGDMNLLLNAVKFYTGAGLAAGNGISIANGRISIDVRSLKEMTA